MSSQIVYGFVELMMQLMNIQSFNSNCGYIIVAAFLNINCEENYASRHRVRWINFLLQRESDRRQRVRVARPFQQPRVQSVSCNKVCTARRRRPAVGL